MSVAKPPNRKPARKPAKKRVQTQKRLDWQKEYQENRTSVLQDIGEIPTVKNPERRAAAENSFPAFCKSYLGGIFFLPWSKDLLHVCAMVENVVLLHDKLAVAMPRGSGKTRLMQAALLWATLYSHHSFSVLIGAVAQQGVDAILWFKDQLTHNELLQEDFPEICYPISRIDNEPRRCLGQRFKGVKTNIRWSTNRIVLPTIPGSRASGAVIYATSLEGHIRGLWAPLPDGRVIRPTLALGDDPQTPETARSQGPTGQTTYRLQVIRQDVQGLAGPTQRTAMLIPGTVICRGDLMDQLLDRKKFPEFRGERTKRLYSWPTNKELWESYREIREAEMRYERPAGEANEFYRARMCDQGRKLDEPGECENCQRRKECLDCGAVVDWAERKDDPRNLSAVQAAMHEFYEYGPEGFASEFQNEPLLSEAAARMPTVQEIIAKANGYPRGMVPTGAIHTVAFIDPGEYYHAYMVASFGVNFTGAVVDFGTWPDQGLDFSKSKANHKLCDKYPGTGKEGWTLAGLRDLMEKMKGMQFPQEGGPPQQIEQCLIDTGHFPDSVHAAIRVVASPVFRASRGVGITAGKTQFDDYKRDRCREIGLHWWVPKDAPTFTVQIDTNFYKTFAFLRLATALGDPGCLSLYGKPEQQRLLASHFLAEYFNLPSTEKGVAVQEWHQHVGKDNEGLDCLVGCLVAASRLGCSVIPTAPRVSRRVRVPIDQMLARRQTQEVA